MKGKHVPPCFTEVYDYIAGELRGIPEHLLEELQTLGEKLHPYGFNFAALFPSIDDLRAVPRRPIYIDQADAAVRIQEIIPVCLEYGIDLQPMHDRMTAVGAPSSRSRRAICREMWLAVEGEFDGELLGQDATTLLLEQLLEGS